MMNKNKRFPDWEDADVIIRKLVNTSFKLSSTEADSKMFSAQTTFFITIDEFPGVFLLIPEKYLFEVIDYFGEISYQISKDVLEYKDFINEINMVYKKGIPYDFTEANKTYAKVLEKIKKDKGIDYKKMVLQEMGCNVDD